jgi:hypothetical protein
MQRLVTCGNGRRPTARAVVQPVPPQLPIERPAVFRSSRPRVEDEVVEWVPAVGHHFDVHVLREDEDGCAGVAAADADVVQPTVVPQDERAVRVDLVVADTEVGLPTAGPKKNDVAGHLRMVSCDIAVERVTGIEPAQSAWKAGDRRHRCWARLRPADRVFPHSRVMLCASVCATAGRSQLSAAMRR